MLHKLYFRVISASSQDNQHKAIELVNHTPGSKGWYSSNFCIYPQEIILELESRSHIKKIQLLSHQFMIATKVEFFVGDCPSNIDISVHNSRFSRLGYVGLSDNEKTQFKARELKSVHVDAVGRYIKIIVHKNYINKYNHYNQVGIIAVNIIGEELNNANIDEIENVSNIVNSDVISPTEDLAFDMRVDAETANIIRRLEKEKSKAVENEQFDKAQKIKDKIVYLIELGEMIGKMEIEKKNAVEKQNYDRAQLKKQQIEQYRQNIYQELDIMDLMYNDRNKVIPPKKQNYDIETYRHQTPLNQNNNAIGPDDYIFINNEDRPLPALRNKKNNVSSPKDQEVIHSPPPNEIPSSMGFHQKYEEPIDDTVDSAPPDESVIPGMTKNDISEASDAIEVYGMALVSRIYSKNWSHREDALLEIKKRLESLPNDSDKDDVKSEIKAAACILKKAFKTRMTQVIQLALSINELILVDLANRLNIAKPEIHTYLDRVTPEIFKCVEDMKVQIRDLAYQHLVEMIQWEHVKQLPHIYQESIKPFSQSALVKDGIIKIRLLLDIYSIHGLCNHFFTLDNFMKFAANALQHKSAEVRENAEALIVVLYRNEDKYVVRSYLPPDDMKTRKNILYKRLFEKLDKIDGIDPDQQQQSQPQHQQPVMQKQPKDQSKQNTSRTTQSKKPNITPSPRQVPTKPNTNQLPPPYMAEQDLGLAPYDETVCIFCGERNDDFVNNIDMHYWKYCPILRRCPHCKQAVEISLLTQHLLQECDQASQFSECPRCSEAILKSEFEQHVNDQLCNPAEPTSSLRCPLCHENLPLTGQYKEAPETLWQYHLMDETNGCQQNPRRLVTLQRQRQQQNNDQSNKGANPAAKTNSNKKRSQLPKAKAK